MPAEVSEQTVNIDLAKSFFEQVCSAYTKGDQKTFEAARTILLVSLGLSTEKSK